MVTSSSAAVGWTAITAAKSALVAVIFTAMPPSWIISPASAPTIWRPDDMAADHPIGGAVDHKLHEGAGVAAGERCFHRPERGLVDVDLDELAARLRFGQPDRPAFGLRKHRGRHILVVDRRGLLAEH